jgi:hypothetical protein
MANFALNGDGGLVVQQSTASGAGSQTRLDGGGSGSYQGAGSVSAQQQDMGLVGGGNSEMRTIDSLNKLTQGMLQPLVEQQKKQMYFQGMAEVAQGKAMIDVKNEQPKWTQIFGPDATTQGAQQMTAMTAMNRSQTDFMAAMPDLRKQSPDQVRQYLVDQASKIGSTGDQATDMLVQAKLGEQMMPMLQTHMQHHLQYIQEQNINAYGNNQISTGDAEQASIAAAAKVQDQSGIDASRGRIRDNLAQLPGMTDEAWIKATTQSITANGLRGNFAYVDVAKQTPEVWNKLPLEARDAIDKQMPLWAEKHRLNDPNSADILTSRQGLVYNLTQGTTGIPASPDGEQALRKIVDDMNTKDRTLNGSTTPMIDNSMYAKLVQSLYAGDAKMKAATAKAGNKQANYDEGVTDGLSALNSGQYAQLKSIPYAPGSLEQAADETFKKSIGDNTTPDQAQTTINKLAAVSEFDRMRSPLLAQQFQQQLQPLVAGNQPATPAMAQTLAYASMMLKAPNGTAALTNYLGDSAPKVIALLNSGIDINDPDQLLSQRQVLARAATVQPTPEDKKAATAVVAGADPGWFKQMVPFVGGPGQLTEFNLNDGNKQALATQIGPQIAKLKTAFNYTDEQAAKVAFAQSLKHADFVPGAFILHNPAVSDGSFSEAVNKAYPGFGNQTDSGYQQAVKSLVSEQVTSQVQRAGGDMKNFSADDYQIQTGEQLGGGHMVLMLVNKKTLAPLNVYLDARDVGKRYKDTYAAPKKTADDNSLAIPSEFQ